MATLRDMSTSDCTPFMRVVFGQSSPTAGTWARRGDHSEVGDVDFLDSTLNQSQRNAIEFALEAEEVALIHGPPGVSTPTAPRSRGCLTLIDWENIYVD